MIGLDMNVAGVHSFVMNIRGRQFGLFRRLANLSFSTTLAKTYAPLR